MKLLILDGNSILNRAFYGIKVLTTKEGLYTNGIYGFLTMLQRLRDEVDPNAVAVAFDRKEPTFRHKAYDGYKANRRGMPPELAQQLPILKELLTALGYRLVECPGFEADDILGTLAAQAERTGNDCVIATGDRDSLQLVSPAVTVRLAATKMGRPEATLYDEAKIMEVYGVTPKELIEIKAIQGDSSDCIPGVKGIGQKGAAELIQRYHSVQYLYDHINELEIKEGLRTKLKAGEESARLSRMLGTIRTDAPVDLNLEDYRLGEGDRKEALRLMAKLEFFSLIDKMGLRREGDEPVEEARAGGELTVTEESPEAFLKAAEEEPEVCLALAYGEEGEITQCAFLKSDTVHLVTEGAGKAVMGLCSLEGMSLCVHNSKPLFAWLDRMGGEARVSYDAMLAAYLLNPNASDYSLKRLQEEAGTAAPKLENETAWQAAVLPRVKNWQAASLLANGQQKLLEEMEIPLAQVLARMENIGFLVDGESIRVYGERLETEIEALQKQIYEEVGYEFNINSPKQLGDALFVKLGLPSGKKTKTGYSTNAEILEKLRYDHPAVELVLHYRTLTKLKPPTARMSGHRPDGRIIEFNQTETRTGRISSTEPNLQNIPVRTELGRELRKFFLAKEGWVLVDADYSQIELRVLAHIAHDENMIKAFQDKEDIHTITASQVFGMPPEMVTPLMRSRAKAVNFGIVYGIGAFSLSKDINVSRKEAQRYIDDYLTLYSGVDRYMKEVVEKAKEDGYVETLFHRRRYLPELTASNFNLRAFGERVARNMPIQGTAADIIKIAMVRVDRRLKRENMRARLILQVHDELIVEAPEDEAEQAARILTEEMEGAVSLTVPMVAEASVGKTWYDAKG
ncbi:MAG: DNA polymerase I [[Clostridium] leptum]